MKKSLFALAALAAMGDLAIASARVTADKPRGHELKALNAGGLLANIDSATLNKNDFMQAFGDGNVVEGQVALAANPTAADVIRVMKVPAGNKISALLMSNDDLDSNGSPTIVHSIGYVPVVVGDGPVASPAYFAAAGQTNLQSANPGKVYMGFDPISFEKDVYITMTVGTAAATFAAGNIRMALIGAARGIK